MVDTLIKYTDADWEVVQTLEDPRPNSVSILGIIWFIGLQNDNQIYPALVLKRVSWCC
jgi:hypothetical protein